jgi:intracellular multiplication protein IcmJ
LLPIRLSLSAEVTKPKSRQGSDGMIAAPTAFDPNTDEETRERILERDNHCCRYCSYYSKKFHLIHVLDGNPKNKKDDNLVTSCIFCNQCFHLDKVSSMKSGVFVWMPEISQTDLHHLARAIYVARITQGPMAETARQTLEFIMKRREEAIERIKTDDPNILTTVLTDYIDQKFHKEFYKKLDGIRLFPLDRRTVTEGELEFNQFPQILAYWRSKDGPFSKLMPNDWIDQYAEIKAA